MNRRCTLRLSAVLLALALLVAAMPAPKVTATATPTYGISPLAVAFSAVASGGKKPYAYAWTFGDGGTAAIARPSHTYAGAGMYLAQVIVTDKRNLSAMATVRITVTAKEEPKMATYYVATTGNDEAAGDIDHPWATLAKAVSGASSGDTVYFRSGTWTAERLDISYKTLTSKTTWARYPDDPVDSVVLDGTDLTPLEWDDAIIFIKGSDYVCIDGLKVTNSANHGIILISTNHTEILNCTTYTTAGCGIETDFADDVKLLYNKVYYPNLTRMGDECITFGFSTNCECAYNEMYAGNRPFTFTGGEGLNCQQGCSYIYFHHNLVDQARPDAEESDRYCMGFDAGFPPNETHHLYFYNNILKNGSWGLNYNSEEGGSAHHIYGWNNIIIHCGHSDRMHGGGIGFPSYASAPGPCDYTYFWNNTIYDCYYGFKADKEELGTGQNYVQNNIIYGSEAADIYFGASDEGDVILDHNLLTTDPKFVNAAGGNFHLQSDSPAIDAGVTLSGPPDYTPNVGTDYDGVARPQGAAFDIGAYEYNLGSAITKTRMIWSTRVE